MFKNTRTPAYTSLTLVHSAKKDPLTNYTTTCKNGLPAKDTDEYNCMYVVSIHHITPWKCKYLCKNLFIGL